MSSINQEILEKSNEKMNFASLIHIPIKSIKQLDRDRSHFPKHNTRDADL